MHASAQWLDPVGAQFDGHVLIGHDLMVVNAEDTLE